VTDEETQKERDELLERVRKAEKFANECLAEVVVYRKLLENCYKAATKASESGNVSFLHTVMGLHLFNIPDDDDVKEWGRDFVYAYSRDAAWLETTKQSLEKIKVDAEKFSVEANTPNAELKESILKAAREGLIPQI
jgi:hypothetical protein